MMPFSARNHWVVIAVPHAKNRLEICLCSQAMITTIGIRCQPESQLLRSAKAFLKFCKWLSLVELEEVEAVFSVQLITLWTIYPRITFPRQAMESLIWLTMRTTSSLVLNYLECPIIWTQHNLTSTVNLILNFILLVLKHREISISLHSWILNWRMTWIKQVKSIFLVLRSKKQKIPNYQRI